MLDKLFRPYQNGRPVTTKWYRTREEAVDWGKTFPKGKIDIVSKDVNELLRKRKKTGFRGLI